jgi:HAD superfamily hydrolase (TIGR01509 family)
LWDLDGTLADTAQLHYHAWQATMDEYGVAYDYAEFLAGFGRNISAYKERTFRRRLAEGELALLPGVANWLAALQAAGVQQLISSSGPMANIAATVVKLAIGDYFLGLLSGADLPRGKPHPDLFLNSAAAAGVPVAACVVIEDSVHGIEAARRAGMASIVVGPLATDPQLTTLLAEVTGPPCLPVGDLRRASWAMWEELWANV